LFVLTAGGAQEDLGLGAAARSAVLKAMRAVPEPFRPAAAATSHRILVDPAGWMRPAGGPVDERRMGQPAAHLRAYRGAARDLVRAADDGGTPFFNRINTTLRVPAGTRWD
jgi:hypothetical protein